MVKFGKLLFILASRGKIFKENFPFIYFFLTIDCGIIIYCIGVLK